MLEHLNRGNSGYTLLNGARTAALSIRFKKRRNKQIFPDGTGQYLAGFKQAFTRIVTNCIRPRARDP